MLIGHVVASFLAQAGFHAFTSLLPLELASRGAPTSDIGFVMGLGGFTQIPASLVAGALFHRFGAMTVLGIGIGAYGLGAVCVALASAVPGGLVQMNAAARSLQGAGYGFVVPAALTYASLGAPVVLRSRWVGSTAAATHLAFVVFVPVAVAVAAIMQVTGVVVLTMASLVAAFVLFRFASPARLVPRHARFMADDAAPPQHSLWSVHLSIGLLSVLTGLIFTRIPSLAGGEISAVFFALTGLGVITGRLVVGRALRPSQIRLSILSTGLTVLGIAALALDTSVLAGAAGGLALGLGSGILMQVLTDRLTILPSSQHGRQLARYSAAVALGLGLGGFAAGLFTSREPVREPFFALLALALAAMAVAVASQRRTEVREVVRA